MHHPIIPLPRHPGKYAFRRNRSARCKTLEHRPDSGYHRAQVRMIFQPGGYGAMAAFYSRCSRDILSTVALAVAMLAAGIARLPAAEPQAAPAGRSASSARRQAARRRSARPAEESRQLLPDDAARLARRMGAAGRTGSPAGARGHWPVADADQNAAQCRSCMAASIATATRSTRSISKAFPAISSAGISIAPRAGRANCRACFVPTGIGKTAGSAKRASRRFASRSCEGAERFEDGGRFPLQARCVQLARMGCIVFQYDMEGYADSGQISQRGRPSPHEAPARDGHARALGPVQRAGRTASAKRDGHSNLQFDPGVGLAAQLARRRSRTASPSPAPAAAARRHFCWRRSIRA